MPIAPEPSRDVLLRFIRSSPRSTQACRDHMHLAKNFASLTTEELLTELRDEGDIAFANGCWYVVDATARPRAKPRKKPHPRQTDMFDPEAGHQYEGPSRQALLFAEQWRREKR